MKIRIPFAYGLIAILLGSSAAPPPSAKGLTFEIVETPAAAGSLAPNLCSFGNHFALNWIDRDRNRKGAANVRVAGWNGKAFGDARTVATSKQMFANWADIPSVIEAPSGDLYAHWLDRISSKTYAYGIRIVRSTDSGKTWKPMGWLHNDTSPTEHGFVSFAPEGKHVRAFWLDGRAMANKSGKMMLRTAILDGNKIKDERVLDDDVCTCCPISAAPLATGPMVIYRDRSPKEIRDIAFTRTINAKWTKPAVIHADNWFFPACPVNGASIATHGNLIAISRYTIANNKAQVILRLSKTDKPKSGRDIVLDANNPTGRCATVCTKDAVFTIWIGNAGKQTALQLAQVSHNGKLIRKTTLAPINGGRSSGMPRAVISGGYLWVTWTDKNRVRLGRTKIPTTPR
ncbi:MAG TPA: exo-alpha-sialidase [Verrucomicrobiales bacterium]|nr:exo-alpha-sialidase [Verrucomicrobiales bacterium]